MLKSLEIKNVALIDSLNIEFCPKLNVLSGETGAGKSIIIDALSFIIGGKANKNLIKQGQDFLKVSAIFEGDFNDEAVAILNNYDIEFDNEILITRKLNIDGKTDIKINGTSVTANMLKNLCSFLIDIHGQHEHQKILKDKYHIEILDLFIKNKDVFAKYAEELTLFKDIQNQIVKLSGKEGNQERELDLLSYQINEIEQAKLKIGEEEDLMQKKTIMLNSERIYDALNDAISELDGSSSIDSVKKVTSLLQGITKYDDSLLNTVERLDSIKYELIDILELIKDKKNTLSFNEYEFEQIDERLDKIKSLKKKYGSTVEEVLKYLDKSKQDYDFIINSKEKLKELQKKKDEQLKVVYKTAEQISNLRRTVAREFEKNVKLQLNDLGMKNSQFKVNFLDMPTLSESEKYFSNNGFDCVNFMFSANAGQNLRPLSEIVSGGEASRFMLALKNILAEIDNIGIMVFDEIDTGISGDMGYKVACKMANISNKHQVMAVSHLPQICAMADCNIKVVKSVVDGQTVINTDKLNKDETLKEIARLSGGIENSAVSFEHARELKNRCEEYKKSLI